MSDSIGEARSNTKYEPKRGETRARRIRPLFIVLLYVLGGVVSAQYYGPYQDPYQAQMAQYDAYMEAWIAQQYANIAAMQQQSTDQFVQYYRQATGDYQTPDHLAAEYGMNLYCQHNAAHCAEVHASWSSLSADQHNQRMNDIASWGAVNSQIAGDYQSILDGMYTGHMERGAMTSEGQSNLVIGAIQGNGTYLAPNSGASWNLPLYPDPNWSYTAPTGEPLSFDYNTGVWYLGTPGGWMPLQQTR